MRTRDPQAETSTNHQDFPPLSSAFERRVVQIVGPALREAAEEMAEELLAERAELTPT